MHSEPYRPASLPLLLAAATMIVALASASTSSFAGSADALKGQYTFNWLTNPAKAKCVAVGEKLLAKFNSPAFKCDLNVATNTASGNPVRVCAATSGETEYLVFETRKACDEEREAQAANSEE
jgi:hypothetical protein